jgi:hypothetical protein
MIVGPHALGSWSRLSFGGKEDGRKVPMSSQLRRDTHARAARVSPVERIRAEIDQLFADPTRDLGDVVEDVARLDARLPFPTPRLRLSSLPGLKFCT